MRNILISIKPQYVCKILNKEKILEIRKSVPKSIIFEDLIKDIGIKDDTRKACKVYIYCTKGKPLYKSIESNEYLEYYSLEHWNETDTKINGKVVAEFTLNKYDIIERDLNDWLPKNRYETTKEQLKDSCLTEEELWRYGQGKQLYAWHIDDLIIYDKPKELESFSKFGYEPLGYSSICGNRSCPFFADSNCYDLPPDCLLDKDCVITKAPQSYCYVV